MNEGDVPPAFACHRSVELEPLELAAYVAADARSHQSEAFEPSQILPADPLVPNATLVTETEFDDVSASPPEAVEALKVSWSWLKYVAE